MHAAMTATQGGAKWAASMAPSTANAVWPEKKKSLPTSYVTSSAGNPGFLQMIPGGGGNVHKLWQICRKPNRMRTPRNGANVRPKIAAAMSERPKRSMNKELVMSVALAALGLAWRCACHRAVRL